jgi:hypothetical protein
MLSDQADGSIWHEAAVKASEVRRSRLASLNKQKGEARLFTPMTE